MNLFSPGSEFCASAPPRLGWLHLHDGLIRRSWNRSFLGTGIRRLPLLVMEYVEGVPIGVYCREHQKNTREILATRPMNMFSPGSEFVHQHRRESSGCVCMTA
jgi:hypothetical protein